MKEKWKDLADKFWGQFYEVSNLGQIRSKTREYQVDFIGKGSVRRKYNRTHEGKILKPRTNGIEKHLFCDLRNNNEGSPLSKSLYIHKAVMEAFSPAPKDIIVRMKLIEKTGYHKKSMHSFRYVEHIDGDYTNNRLDNLRWITALDLYRKQVKNGRKERMDLYKSSSVWKKSKSKEYYREAEDIADDFKVDKLS